MKYLLRTGLALLYLLTAPLAVAQQDVLLPPEQAFDLQAWIEGDYLVAEYSIAPGYYMYRERIDFQIESGGARFDTAIMPDGKIKNDEFFGDMEVYRGNLRIELPILYDAGTTENLTVRATGQGCADIGICYLPLTQRLEVNTRSTARIYPVAYTAALSQIDQGIAPITEALPSLLADAGANFSQLEADQTLNASTDLSSLSAIQSLAAELGLGNDDDIPPPDTAFQLSAVLDQNNNIQTSIQLYPNTYLYKDKIAVSLVDGKGHRIDPVALPSGKNKKDEFFGDMEVYYDQVNFAIRVLSDTGASEQYVLEARYQGCVVDRICYPPITKYLGVNQRTGLIDIGDQPPQLASINNRIDTLTSSSVSDSGTYLAAREQLVSEQDRFTQLLFDGSILFAIGLFFLAGIALAFTPCVFPMVPILSSLIIGQGKSITTRRAFSLSLVYVLSMATTYAIVGAIVGYFGAKFNIQIWFQDPWVLSIFAAIFVLLALSMFGFYELQMPNAIQTRLAAISHSKQGGTYTGVGVMGLFSAIIVGPCITAPLVGALFFISQTQDWQLGGLALFALGLGMGVPLLLIGTAAGKLIRRAGDWVEPVKSVFGVILLGVAIWMLERILPVAITMVLIASLIIASAVYMGALSTLPASVSGWRKLNKSLGVILLIYGGSFLLGALAGSKDLIQPLRGIMPNTGSESTSAQPDGIVFRRIKGEQGLQQALANSARLNQPTMLVFYADWCVSCKEMEKYTFKYPDVVRALDTVAILQADVTDNDAIDTELMSTLGIYGPPAILFFDPTGQEVRNRRVVGIMSGKEFAAHITQTFPQLL